MQALGKVDVCSPWRAQAPVGRGRRRHRARRSFHPRILGEEQVFGGEHRELWRALGEARLPLVEEAFGVYFASREMMARLEQRCAEARGAHNRPAVPAP